MPHQVHRPAVDVRLLDGLVEELLLGNRFSDSVFPRCLWGELGGRQLP